MGNKYLSFFMGLAITVLLGNLVLKSTGLQPVGLWMLRGNSATAEELSQ